MSTYINKLGRLDADISKLEAQIRAKHAERLAVIDAIRDEAQQAAGLSTEYTGKRRGVAPGTRPVTPAKFTDEQIQDMRDAYDNGASQSEIARDYGIAQPTVWRIVNRKSYGYVPERTNLTVVA